MADGLGPGDGVSVGGDLNVEASEIAIGAARDVHVHPRSAAPGQPYRYPGRQTPVFGRAELLVTLNERLKAARRVSPVVLTGLGGVGKTTVALEYAWRYADDYSLVWFFWAEEAAELTSQFRELAHLLGAKEGADPVTAVHAVLARYAGPWLLVFDDMPGHGFAAKWLPARGDGHVLVTTRDGHWPAAQALEVSTISTDAASELLLGRTRSDDVDSARAVADALGLLPLALEQAAAFCETTGRTLAEYRGLLDSDWADLLDRNAPAGHSAPVTGTFSLAVMQLEEATPGSVTLLRIAAYLAPEGIPFRLLLPKDIALPLGLDPQVVERVTALTAGGLALDDAVAGLRRYSLIGPPSRTFGLHRLVQTVTRDELGTDGEAWRNVAAALVEMAIPADVQPREAWETCRQLISHARVVLDPFGEAMRRLSESLEISGDYAAARSQWQFLADVHKDKLGAEHPDTLTVRTNLAHWTGEAGDAEKARDLFQELLPVQIEVWGPEDPGTLTAWSRFAQWTGEAGDPAQARDRCAELLSIRERVSGPEHPETLAVRANLAYYSGVAGEPEVARRLYADLVTTRERVSGPEHPYTLTDRSNLARWTGEAGDAEKVRDMFREQLPVWERVAGPRHPGTLTVQANLASWTGVAGDARTARELFTALLPLQEQVSGPGHPDTNRVRVNLDFWSRKARG